MSKLLIRALQDSSVRERTGDADHPTIMGYFATADHRWVPHDEYAWCSAAMCHWVTSVGGMMPETYRLRARSWLTLGPAEGYKVVDVQGDLQIGDITVLWRRGRTSVFGHVALYTDATSRTMQLYGGNQNDGNRLTRYPNYRLVGARRLL